MRTKKDKKLTTTQTWIWIIIIFAIIFSSLPGGSIIIALLFLASTFFTKYISKGKYEKYELMTTIDNEIENKKRLFEEEQLQRLEEKNRLFEKLTREHDNSLNILKADISSLQSEKEKLSYELLFDDVTPNTSFEVENISSTEIKNKLSLLLLEEKELLKNDVDIIQSFDSSKKFLNAQIKQILRSFNAETDNVISNLTIKNIDTSRNKITKSFEALNKIYKIDGVKLYPELLELKLKKLNLTYEYQHRKELEREQQKSIKDQMVEEEKVRREIIAEKKKIEKEEKQFTNELTKLLGYLQKTDSEIEKTLYVEKIKELEVNIELLKKDKENVEQRETNTRAGFVYIISNIGSFGENVYKIGMTRRLEPMDRIKELSSASVPFEFDVHAMIFSEDAPHLEHTLHQHFKDQAINKVNPRKEFFNVDIRDIEKIVTEEFNTTVEFTLVAKAEQYRQSLELKAI